MASSMWNFLPTDCASFFMHIKRSVNCALEILLLTYL